VGPSRSDLAECSVSTFLPEDRPNATQYSDTLGESRHFGATSKRRELRASNACSRHPIWIDLETLQYDLSRASIVLVLLSAQQRRDQRTEYRAGSMCRKDDRPVRRSALAS
jgi:hypothetical protein